MAAEIVTRRNALRIGAVLSAGFALSACSTSAPSQPVATASGATASTGSGKVFRFAQAAQIQSLDPTATTRIESHRISTQILEPLVGADVNTGEPVPGLASQWDISDDGLTYTFTLDNDLTFSDGSSLTAHSISRNFDRWKALSTAPMTRLNQAYAHLFAETPSLSGQPAPALINAWSAENDTRFTVTLSRHSASFLKALTQPACGIMKPDQFANDAATVESPIGSGAFTLKSWDGTTAVLERSEKYRGAAPEIDRLEFVTIPGAEKRYYNLVEGRIDAYDQVALKDYVPLALDGYAVQSRDPYAVAYIGINLAHPAFDDLRARQALACAIDRAAIISAYYPQGTKTASDFIPALFQMKNPKAGEVYNYSATQAKELLRTSTYANQSIDFYYPVNVSLASLPSPEGIYSLIATNLISAGFNIVPKPYRWTDEGSDDIPAKHPNYGLELAGFIGAYRDPTAFLGQVLAPASTAPAEISMNPGEATSTPAPSTTEPATDPSKAASSYTSIMQAIGEADSITDISAWRDAYRKLNAQVSELLPAIPLAYPVSGVTQGARVTSYTVTATCLDVFSTVDVEN